MCSRNDSMCGILQLKCDLTHTMFASDALYATGINFANPWVFGLVYMHFDRFLFGAWNHNQIMSNDGTDETAKCERCEQHDNILSQHHHIF